MLQSFIEESRSCCDLLLNIFFWLIICRSCLSWAKLLVLKTEVFPRNLFPCFQSPSSSVAYSQEKNQDMKGNKQTIEFFSQWELQALAVAFQEMRYLHHCLFCCAIMVATSYLEVELIIILLLKFGLNVLFHSNFLPYKILIWYLFNDLATQNQFSGLLDPVYMVD